MILSVLLAFINVSLVEFYFDPHDPVAPLDISWQSQQNLNNFEEGPHHLNYFIMISVIQSEM